jgi:hypothetical protein
MKLRVTLLLLLAALSAPARAQNAAPGLTARQQARGTTSNPTAATKPDTKAPPAEKVYDESADAGKQVDAALAKAAKENQRVLISGAGTGARGASSCTRCSRTTRRSRVS